MRLSIVVMIILGAGIGWLWWSQQRDTVSPAWQGYAEADYVKVATVEQGMLTTISVARGERDLHAGDAFLLVVGSGVLGYLLLHSRERWVSVNDLPVGRQAVAESKIACVDNGWRRLLRQNGSAAKKE